MRLAIQNKRNSPLYPLKGKFALKELAKKFNAIAPWRGLGVIYTTNKLH